MDAMIATISHAANLKLIAHCSGREISRGTLFWLLQVSGWAAFGLMMLGYALARERPGPAFFDVSQLIVSGAILTSLYRFAYRWWRRRGISLFRLAGWIFLLSLVGVPLWYEPQAALSLAVRARYPKLVSWAPSYTDIPFDTWLVWGTVLLSWSFLYFGINDWMSLQVERRRAAAAEALVREARLRALQSQLQPHFLFNTLNSIASLVLDGRTDAAVAMVSRIADFLRLSLQTSESPRIPLEQELAFLGLYLEIERLRFGDRLNYRFEVPPETLTLMVPTLLLQPLVENAVRHGILPSTEGGSVVIGASVTGDFLTLQVEDDGPGLVTKTTSSCGIGLANTATRLEEIYGNRGRMSVGKGAMGGVDIKIRIPLCSPAEECEWAYEHC
jgi:two-component system, LytTR family, sensor kinase